jgi:DNA-binding FadR family transcriptional regulator
MAKFKSIKQPRASEEVLTQIKESILRGHYREGDRLPSERELTEQFRVSRGVVREALRVLEMTGLVEVRQGPCGGAFVQSLSCDHLSTGFLDLYLVNKLTVPELNHVRVIMEPEVARMAAQNVTPEFAQRLKDATASERTPEEVFDSRLRQFTGVHYILAEMCGNALFEAIVNSMITLTHRIIMAVEPKDYRTLHGVGEHDEVVEAVLAQDSEAAYKTMRAHLLHFCEGLVRMDQEYRGLLLM